MQLNEVAAMIRLVCLPYAGGGTAPFHRWRPMMPADIELAAAGAARTRRPTQRADVHELAGAC